MKRVILSIAALAAALFATAQTDSVPTGADYLQVYKKSDCIISFDVNAEGQPFHVKWGMDTAWDWDYNINRGIAHIGKGNFETGRVSFQPYDLAIDNGDGTYSLTTRMQRRLKTRIDRIKTTGTNEVNLNCDHEALFKRMDSNGNLIDTEDRTGYNNYVGKPEQWYRLIKASTAYVQSQGLTVVSVSPFNEPDYCWSQYTGAETNGMKDFLAIAKLIKADPFFDGIRVCGGNTLNCDRALPWYNALKDYLDEGNTHQLAGSFSTYANFFATVKNDGKVATADELHNVGEAIVGANYGMTNGIWWGFDAMARGQFCVDSNQGTRLGYGEDRSHWTAGAVYRNNQSGEIHGFIGSSERQANNSTYEFVSRGKDVYFNGFGPTRHWSYTIPGGTAYQTGQINAELLFDITYGDDVAPLPEVNGTYQIMNANRKVITMSEGAVKTSTRSSKGSTTQQWHVYPGHTDGDCSYWFIDNAGNANAHFNVRDRNLNSGTEVICYNAGHVHEEQWYIKYAHSGYYYIISRISNKYLYCSSTTDGTKVTLREAPAADITPANHKKYLWRFMPVDAKAETTAPDAPTALTARQRAASVTLSWTASAADDVASYTILRSDSSAATPDGDASWNTIARQIPSTSYVDNTVQTGHAYQYRVVAVDYSGNRSEPSAPLAAAPLAEPALVCQLQFDNSLADATANANTAQLFGSAKYDTSTKISSYHKSGTAALQLNGTTNYAVISPSLVDSDELTIAAWLRLGSTTAWQRLFDFGCDTDHYMFFTPSTGQEMRFVMRNGGDEQVLGAGRRLTTSTSTWSHVAITLRPLSPQHTEAILYVDGVEVARKSDFTIRPSHIAPSLCFIGRSMYSGDPLLNARIDDFRIYNYALSPQAVAAILTDTDPVSASCTDSYVDTSLPTSVRTPLSPTATATAYDLNGRTLPSPTQGVVIQAGKKVLGR